jgi:hypothetical protein
MRTLETAYAFRIVLLAAASCVGAAACGHVASDEQTPAKVASPLSYGEVFALVTTSVTTQGEPGYVFGAKLTSPEAVVDPCEGATSTVGSCCYVPPPATAAAPSKGPAGLNPDGGLTYVDERAGTLTLSRGTGETLAKIDYGTTIAGFGQGNGYPNQMINPTTWGSGDELRVSATGEDGHLPAFQASIRGVALPDVPEQTSIKRSDVSFSWTPDASADTVTLTLDAYAEGTPHGKISCTVPDAAGKVTVDPTLTANYAVGDECWASLRRDASQVVELDGGHVTVRAKADYAFTGPIE